MNNPISVRPYFSYSQFSCFKFSPKKFIDQYYYGKRDDNNCYLKLGKELGEALRFRKVKRNEVLEKIKKQIPPAPIYEKELKVEFNNIPLLAYLDGFDDDNYILYEYKSGKKSSEKSWREQMLFYCLILFLLNKRIPNKIELYWAETKLSEDDQLYLTGNVRKYNMNIAILDIIRFGNELNKVYKQIQELVQNEYMMFGTKPVGGKKK